MMKIKGILSWFLAKRIRLVAIIVLVVITGFFFFKSRSTTPVGYQTTAVERGNIIASVSASGSILSSNYIPVTTNASGVVSKVYVKDGDKVTKGQRIMELELDSLGSQTNAQAYASYLSAKNNLASSNSTVYTLQSQSFAANQKFINDAVARDLPTNDPTYIQEYADWKAAEAKYIQQSQVISQGNASLNSSYLSYLFSAPVVVAPAGGIITNLTYTPGMVLATASSSTSSSTSGNTDRIAVIKTTGNPLAAFNVSEVDVSKVKIGQKVTITLDSISDKTFTGVVASVDKVGSTSNGVTNYPVVIKFDTTSPEILPNMSATANIIIDSKSNVLVVPTSGVTTTSGQSTVRILRGGNPESVSVETGLSSDTQVEIVSGLSEGEEVVTGIVSQTTSSSSTRSVFSTGGFGGGGNVRVAR